MRSLSSTQASEGNVDGECMSIPYELLTKLYLMYCSYMILTV